MIHVIGDSHVGLFAGTDKGVKHWPTDKSAQILPWFKCYRLGGCLAYKICEPNTRTSGHRRLMAILDTLDEGSTVMLSFGEIDCRHHLIKQSTKQNRTLESMVEECAERYLSLVLKVKGMGFDVLVWNAVASHPDSNIPDPTNPSNGTCVERNHVTKLLNDAFEKALAPEGVPFIRIFDSLVLESGETDVSYYYDGVHVSSKVLPLLFDQFKKKERPLVKDLVFDVGANEGKLTTMFLEEFSRVIAVEANADLCKKLNNKFDDRVTVINRAASSIADVLLPFYISPENTISTLEEDWINKSRFSQTSKWNAPVEVSSTTLDKLVSKYGNPSLLKVDVEGHELEVLKGLSNPIEYVCFEWVDEMFEQAEACVKQLQSIGYKKFALVYGEYQPGQEEQEYKEWDEINFDTKAKKRYGMLWAHYCKEASC